MYRFKFYAPDDVGGNGAGGANAGGGSAAASPAEGSAGSGSAVPPADAAAGGGAAVSEGGEGGRPPGTGGGAEDGWNGELESIQKEPWWADVPEDKRERVTAGLKAKHGKWQAGYQKKFEEFRTREQGWTKEKEDLQAEVAKSKQSRDYYSDLLKEDDQVKALTEKLTGLESALSEKEKEHGKKLREVETERDRLSAAVESHTLQQKLADYEKKFPDIYADFKEAPEEEFKAGKAEPTGAFMDFLKLLPVLGEERAAAVVRAEMKERAAAAAPAPPAKREVVLPPSMRNMGNGGGPRPSETARQGTGSYDEIRRQKLAEARAEAEQD